MRTMMVVLLGFAAAPAAADLSLTYQDEIGVTEVTVQGQRARIDLPDDIVLLYEADVDRLTVANGADREYSIIERGELERLRARRARTAHRIVKTRRTETIGDLRCRVHRHEIDRRAISTLCVAPLDGLGIAAQDWQTFSRLQSAYAAIGGPAADWSEVDGLVVEFAVAGDFGLTQRLVARGNQALNPATFDLSLADWRQVPFR